MASESVVADAAQPSAEEHGARLPLSDVRWRKVTVLTVYPNGSFPGGPPHLTVLIYADAADDRPPPPVSGFVSGPLPFVMTWSLHPDPDDPGAWQLREVL